MTGILCTVNDHMAKEDLIGLFDNPIEFMICYNTYCVDVAREVYGLSEADYHFMVH